jgi:predicted CoA-binding protein
MQSEGYDVVPINPRYAGQEILGNPGLHLAGEVPRPIGIVDVFRKPADCPDIAREAVEVGAKVLWLQLGVTSDEAGRIAHDGGLEFVQDRCVKIEHARFFGGLNLVGMNTGVISSRRSLV